MANNIMDKFFADINRASMTSKAEPKSSLKNGLYFFYRTDDESVDAFNGVIMASE